MKKFLMIAMLLSVVAFADAGSISVVNESHKDITLSYRLFGHSPCISQSDKIMLKPKESKKNDFRRICDLTSIGIDFTTKNGIAKSRSIELNQKSANVKVEDMGKSIKFTIGGKTYEIE